MADEVSELTTPSARLAAGAPRSEAGRSGDAELVVFIVYPSSPLHRGEHLHAGSGGEREALPRRRGTTSPSTATATPRASTGSPSRSSAAGHGRASRQVAALPVQVDHTATPTNASATTAARGANRIPLRRCPVADTSPSTAPGPITGVLSGWAAEAHGELLDLQLQHAGHQLAGSAQQLIDSARRRALLEAALLHGGAQHVAPVAAGHEVAAAKRMHPLQQPGPAGSRSRRICPLTGRTGTRAAAAAPRSAAPRAGGETTCPASRAHP